MQVLYYLHKNLHDIVCCVCMYDPVYVLCVCVCVCVCVCIISKLCTSWSILLKCTCDMVDVHQQIMKAFLSRYSQCKRLVNITVC